MEHRHVPTRSCDADGYTILDDGTAYDVHEFIGKIRDEVYPRFTDSQKKEWNTIIDEDDLCMNDDMVDFLNGTEFYSDLQVVPYTEKDVENYDGGIFLTEKDCVDRKEKQTQSGGTETLCEDDARQSRDVQTY